jgi:hypothetical protein
MNTAKTRRILINDDGWIRREAEPPLTVNDLKERMVDTYQGSPVGALFWSIGGREVYSYETKVGEMFGEGFETFEEPDDRRNAENIRRLIEECGGPLTAMVDLCHKAGIDMFPSVRMNSHYADDPSKPNTGRFRNEHSDRLIGRPDEVFPAGSMRWGIRTGLDYTHQAVRAHMAAIINELFESFEVDGVEMDFMRHPTFFKVEDAYANRYLMTDLVRRVRRRMDEVSGATGRSIDLAVRVPPTLADSARIGLDVKQWMAEDLVDIVIAGGGFIPFETPVDEFVKAAEGTRCHVYGSIEYLRPAVDDEVIRAIAAHHWDAGASGIYLFNYFGKSAEWKKRTLGEIADPSALRRLDKRFQMDNTRFRWDYTKDVSSRDLHDYAFENSVPPVQLPVALPDTLTGHGVSLRLHIADDVESASAEGELAQCRLTLSFDSYRGEDEIEILLNGEVLPSSSSTSTFGKWDRLEWTGFPTRLAQVEHDGGRLAFDLACPPLKYGSNELEVRLVRRTVSQPDHLVLVDVEVSVGYNRP